jgi:hypothetical protein
MAKKKKKTVKKKTDHNSFKVQREDLEFIFKMVAALFSTLRAERYGVPIELKFSKENTCFVTCTGGGGVYTAKIPAVSTGTATFTLLYGLLRKFSFPSKTVAFSTKKDGRILCKSGPFSGIMTPHNEPVEDIIEDVSDLDVYEVDAVALARCLRSMTYKTTEDAAAVRVVSTGEVLEAHSIDGFQGAYCRVPFKGQSFELMLPRSLCDIIGANLNIEGLIKIGSDQIRVLIETHKFRVVYPVIQLGNRADVDKYITSFTDADDANFIDIVVPYEKLHQGTSQIVAAFRDDTKLTKELKLSLGDKPTRKAGVVKQGARKGRKVSARYPLMLRIVTPIGTVHYSVPAAVNSRGEGIGEQDVNPAYFREFLGLASGKALGVVSKDLKQQRIRVRINDKLVVFSSADADGSSNFAGIFRTIPK